MHVSLEVISEKNKVVSNRYWNRNRNRNRKIARHGVKKQTYSRQSPALRNKGEARSTRAPIDDKREETR
jgi:hypothetical protein